MTGRPAVRRVKLMADYGAFPLWAVPDDGPVSADDPWCGELAPDALPLSGPLVADLRTWADRYDRLRATGLAWPSDRDRAAFVDDGRRLLARVRTELGPAFEVVYFDETTGRVENDTPVEVRRLTRGELSKVAEIDRTERIDLIYEQHGTELRERRGTWDSPTWDPHGHGEHSVAAQRRALEGYADAGGIALGAFSGARLVGIGVVVPHLRPGLAQLAYLHVSRAFRATGIGRRLCDDLHRIARHAGDTEIVVTATPSGNTVRFYLGRGYQPMARPLPELYDLEPEDVHMRRAL